MKTLAEKMVKKEILSTKEVKEYCDNNGLKFKIDTDLESMKKFVQDVQNAYKIAVNKNLAKDVEVLKALQKYLVSETDEGLLEEDKEDVVVEEVAVTQVDETREAEPVLEEEKAKVLEEEVNNADDINADAIKVDEANVDLFGEVIENNEPESGGTKDVIEMLAEIFLNVLDGKEPESEFEKFEKMMSVHDVIYRKGKSIDDIHDHIAQTKKRDKDIEWKLEALEKHFGRSLNQKKKK